MAAKGAVTVRYVLYILVAFLFSFAWILIPAGWGFLLLAAAIVLLLWRIYAIVKAAVKDALREYDKEKAEANGQK